MGKFSEIFGIWVSVAEQQLWAWNWSQPQVVPPGVVTTFFSPPGRETQASPTSVSRTMEDAGTISFVERIREMGLQPRSLSEAWVGELPKRPETAELCCF